MNTSTQQNNFKQTKLNSSGLMLNVWAYFVVFALIIVLLVWVFQFAFVKMYFNAVKLKEMRNIGYQLMDSYESRNYETQVNDIAFANGVFIVVFSTETFQAGVVSVMGEGEGIISSARLLELDAELGNRREASYIGNAKSGETSKESLVYLARFVSKGEEMAIYISAPVAVVEGTTSILLSQLFIVTLVSLLLAFVLSGFMSLKLSRPIVNMSKEACKLAAGDYNVVFEGNGYTEIDELCDTLNYTAQQMSKTDKVRKDLVANVSHDLKTPLTLIKSYAEMVRDLSGDSKEKRDKHLNVIIDEADRLTELVNEMLKLSRLENMSTEFDLKTFDLSELTHKVFEFYDIKTSSSGYTFDIDIEPNLMVVADENKIEQVLYNLVSNAINYVGKDKWIKISLHSKNGVVRFDVFDHGCGIAEEETTLIWDRYYRSADKRKRETTGTGLGLSIAKTILARHNATYGVNSVIGEGSNFFFELKQHND